MMLRHSFLTAALVLLATLRASDGDTFWAVLFAVAAAAEVGVLLVERRRRARAAGDDGTTPARPDDAKVSLSLRAHRQGERLWWGVLALTLAAGTALVWSTPALAAVVAVVSLVALTRVRRERRTIAGLQRLAVAS
jgi:hypothetical protein